MRRLAFVGIDTASWPPLATDSGSVWLESDGIDKESWLSRGVVVELIEEVPG